MNVIMVVDQGIIVSVISVYAPQYGLDESQTDDFYDSLFNIVRNLKEKELVVIAGDFNGHIGSNPKTYKDEHGRYGYGVGNKQREKILDFCAASQMCR